MKARESNSILHIRLIQYVYSYVVFFIFRFLCVYIKPITFMTIRALLAVMIADDRPTVYVPKVAYNSNAYGHATATKSVHANTFHCYLQC